MNPVKDYDHLLEKYLRLIDDMSDLELERQIAAYERDRARMLLESTEAQFLHALTRIAALESGGAEQRNWHSLCVECGPNVAIEEDGCCAMCGGTAMGTWLYERTR